MTTVVGPAPVGLGPGFGHLLPLSRSFSYLLSFSLSLFFLQKKRSPSASKEIDRIYYLLLSKCVSLARDARRIRNSPLTENLKLWVEKSTWWSSGREKWALGALTWREKRWDVLTWRFVWHKTHYSHFLGRFGLSLLDFSSMEEIQAENPTPAINTEVTREPFFSLKSCSMVWWVMKLQQAQW